MLAEAAQADAEEQADSGREQSDALPPELREREQKDVRGRQPKRPESDPDTKVNLSDPDSRVVRDYWVTTRATTRRRWRPASRSSWQPS